MVSLKGDVWLSGWIDFDQLAASSIESKLLKLPKNVSFTASGTGDVVTGELRGTFSSTETAKSVSRLLGNFQTVLDSMSANLMIPPFTCETDGLAIVIRMNFQEQNLEHLLEKVKKRVNEPAEKNQSGSGR